MLWQLWRNTGGVSSRGVCDVGAACIWLLPVCALFVQPELADRQEKTTSFFLESSANATEKAKKIFGAARRLAAQARRAQKVSFQLGGVRFCDCDFFFEKNPVRWGPLSM